MKISGTVISCAATLLFVIFLFVYIIAPVAPIKRHAFDNNFNIVIDENGEEVLVEIPVETVQSFAKTTLIIAALVMLFIGFPLLMVCSIKDCNKNKVAQADALEKMRIRKEQEIKEWKSMSSFEKRLKMACFFKNTGNYSFVLSGADICIDYDKYETFTECKGDYLNSNREIEMEYNRRMREQERANKKLAKDTARKMNHPLEVHIYHTTKFIYR